MAMINPWVQTKREKIGSIDGLNLFFGALLGANLGTLDALPLGEYAQLIGFLAGAVVAIRLVATSERRGYAFGTLAAYLLLLAGVIFVPAMQPVGLADGDRNRLGATILIWVLSAVIMELWPTREVATDQA